MIFRIAKALVPTGIKEVIALAILTPAFAYVGYVALVKDTPEITVYTDAVYPKQVYRDGYFFISADLAFSQTCNVKATRIFTGSDGVDYTVAEDSKDVVAGERMKYIVRVPVTSAVPYGPAWFRSDIEYQCDAWSTYIMPRKTRGRIRAVEILPALVMEKGAQLAMCDEKLIPRPGYSVVKAHYRKRSDAVAKP